MKILFSPSCLVRGLIIWFAFAQASFASSYVQILQGELLETLRAERSALALIEPELARRITRIRPISRQIDRGIDGSLLPNIAEIDAMPAASGDANFACMTEALYFEARSETLKGQFAVAEVILNRAKSAQFPNTICGVIAQGSHRRHACQFSYKCDGLSEAFTETLARARAEKIARLALDGALPQVTRGALYYHTSAVQPKWSRVFERTAAIGVHYFYRP